MGRLWDLFGTAYGTPLVTTRHQPDTPAILGNMPAPRGPLPPADNSDKPAKTKQTTRSHSNKPGSNAARRRVAAIHLLCGTRKLLIA